MKNRNYGFAIPLFCMALVMHISAHEGAEYPKEIRDALKHPVVIPKGIVIALPLKCEQVSLPQREVNKIRQEASTNQKKSGVRELFSRVISSRVAEIKYEIVPGTDTKIEYFSDGHTYKALTKVIRCKSPFSDEKFEIRVNMQALGKLQVELNAARSSFVLRNVFEKHSTLTVGAKIIYIPCSICFSEPEASGLVKTVVPFRSYDKKDSNDLFDGGTSWRWFGDQHLMAQLLVTQDGFGMNTIKEKRVYLFNIVTKKLRKLDISELIAQVPDIEGSVSLDFEAEPINVIMMPVKISRAGGKDETVLIKLKPAGR